MTGQILVIGRDKPDIIDEDNLDLLLGTELSCLGTQVYKPHIRGIADKHRRFIDYISCHTQFGELPVRKEAALDPVAVYPGLSCKKTLHKSHSIGLKREEAYPLLIPAGHIGSHGESKCSLSF